MNNDMIEFSEEIYQQFLNRARKDLVPVGSIMCFPYQKYPSGYLPCDGREVLISQYPDLYHLIGDSFGTPEEKNCFKLPDLQGQFIRGWDNDGDVDPEREFGSHQNFALQGHGHKTKETTTNVNGYHCHQMVYEQTSVSGTGKFSKDVSIRYVPYSSGSFAGAKTLGEGEHAHTIPPLNATEMTNTNYNKVNVATETRPTNIALLYCIKVL